MKDTEHGKGQWAAPLVTGLVLFAAGIVLVVLRYVGTVDRRPWGLIGFVLAVAGALALALFCVVRAVRAASTTSERESETPPS
jgi:drug/metabolite transporter (DMT)-like permease